MDLNWHLPLSWILGAGGLLGLSGFPGIALGWRSPWSQKIAMGFCVAGSLLGLAGAARVLGSGAPRSVLLAWSIPGAACEMSVDPLGAFFLIPVFLMAALGSLYGWGYWRQTDHPANGRRLQFFWGTMMAGFVGLILARNAILFLMGWEIMALSGFFLVGSEDQKPEVQKACWIYFISTHVATLTLIGMFALWRHVTGSFQFRPLAAHEAGLGTLYGLFFLSLLGFGIKAGIMPLHVWLPEAHANAPSHVSAILSGIMLKMGIYGMIRIFGYLPVPPISWGALLVFLGALSGVFGIAFAIGQRDLKRMLAYSSVENIGLIVMGLGLAMVGRSMGRSDWMVLGLAGCLLHVWNHSLFKSLLFMGAGSVDHAIQTRDVETMGGLAKRMPRTAFLFLIGAVAIAGLPPLNGFVSEFLIYLGLFRTLPSQGTPAWTIGAWAAPALALVGALAVACFVKASGMVFLGSPRTERAKRAHESPLAMLGPMAFLGVCCFAIGLGSNALAPVLERALRCWIPDEGLHRLSLASVAPLGLVSNVGMAFMGATIAAVIGCELWMRPRQAPRVGTWDCGYARPSPRMQYTSSSFADMLVRLLGSALRPKVESPRLQELFPAASHYRGAVEDVVLGRFILPTLRVFKWLAERSHVLQRGQLQSYVLYIFGMVVVLLLWTLPVGQLLVRLLTR